MHIYALALWKLINTLSKRIQRNILKALNHSARSFKGSAHVQQNNAAVSGQLFHVVPEKLLNPLRDNIFRNKAQHINGVLSAAEGRSIAQFQPRKVGYFCAQPDSGRQYVRPFIHAVKPNKLRAELFDKMQELPLSFYDKNSHGELMSRFSNDADYVQQMLEQSIVSIFSSSLMFIGIVIILIVTCPPLFLITLLVLAGSFLAIRTIGGRSRRLYQEQQRALGEMNGNIQEMIEGLRVVKAFTHEDAAKAQFGKLNNAYFDVAKDANFYATAMMPIVSNVMNIGYALTAIVGGLFAFGGMLDLGGLAIYLQFGRQISQPMSQVSQQMTSLLSALAGAERIFEIIDIEPEVDEGKVTLVRAQKDENGAISENTGSERYHTWAWKVPRSSRLTLVPVMIEPDGSPVELGQAVHEDGALKMLPPNVDSPEGIWVRAEKDGSLTEVTDLASLASHAWAWKYPDREGCSTLHIVRGSVRNVPGEDFCLTELKGAVRLNDVCFSYVPEKPILKHVSVYANPGQKIAFVGSTGAGKTTITNLINRFYEIDSGMITYDGIDVTDIKKDDLRRSLGAVLQDTHLFTGTVMENIRYGRLDATDEECIAAAKSANAHSFIRRLPDGYNTQVTGDGANLSQGQRQLLAIARAAVADPPVLILDDPFSALDRHTEDTVFADLQSDAKDKVVFLISHRLYHFPQMQKVIFMDGGKTTVGTHAQLMETVPLYRQLYESQTVQKEGDLDEE